MRWALLALLASFRVCLLGIVEFFEFADRCLCNHFVTRWVRPIGLHFFIWRQVAHSELFNRGFGALLVLRLWDKLNAIAQLRIATMANTPTMLRGKGRLLRLLLLLLH